MRPYAIMARGHVVCPSLVIIVVSDHGGERHRQAWSRAGPPVNLLRVMGGTRGLLKVSPATKYQSSSLQSFRGQCRAGGCLSRLYLASFFLHCPLAVLFPIAPSYDRMVFGHLNQRRPPALLKELLSCQMSFCLTTVAYASHWLAQMGQTGDDALALIILLTLVNYVHIATVS